MENHKNETVTEAMAPMQRRSFLLTALAGLLSPAGARVPQTAPAVLLQRSPLAGFQDHAGPRLWSRLRPGQTLTLHREPAKPYDRRAVRIDWQGTKLGYVPRRDNAAVSGLLDRGERVTAHIGTLMESRDPWRRISVEILLHPGARKLFT